LEVNAGLAIDEMTLLGTSTGLVWRKAGEDWRVPEGLPGLVSALVVDPQNPQGVYAGTPVGVFYQAASGAPWQAISPPWVVWDMAIDGGGRLFVARGDGLAYADAPQTGVWQNSVGMESVTFFGVRPNPDEANQIWAGTWGNALGVSLDRGASLTALHNGLETLSALAIWWHATPGQITIGTIEGIYRSDDGGESWFKLPGALQAQTVYALLQSESGALWAGATDGLWVSQDYGVTWVRQEELPPVTVNRLGQMVINGRSMLWAGTEGDGMWVTVDGGARWQAVGPSGVTVYAVVQREAQLMVATDQGIQLIEVDWLLESAGLPAESRAMP
jgi:ligand-binding sensor domain-containing protein